jgi:rifampicin phosphotransferase
MAMVHTIEAIRRNPALLADCGGKGKNLFRLQLQGLPVPPLVVVPYDALKTLFHFDDAPLRKKLTTLTNNNIVETTAEIEHLLQSLPINLSTYAQLNQEVTACLNTSRNFAVRSSVRYEDSAAASFAGMFDTVLNVEPSLLAESIRTCLRSLYKLPLLDYSLQKGVNPAENQLSVVIQEMVQASVSGVLFTMNASGNYNDLLICCALGSGEGVVNNTSETTSYYVNRQNRSVQKKDEEAELLTPEQLAELYETALHIEKSFGFPQDIEFSYDEAGKLHILQARPITTIDITTLKIIDNTNIVESYPGITLPLTFSFAKAAYQEVFTSSARLFKISEEKIREKTPELSTMITHVQGRIYYNLHNWYKLMQMILSSGSSLQAWETLIGVHSKTSFKGVSTLFKKARTAYVSLSLFLRYPSIVANFYRNFEAEYVLFRTYLNDLPKTQPSVKEAFEFYLERSKPLFKDWSATLLNDFFTFRFYDVLTKQTSALGFTKNETIANDLLCGTPGVESEMLVMELLQLSEHIRSKPEYLKLFDRSDEELLNRIPPELQQLFDAFIDRFGDRTLEELKLETPNMRLQPTRFLSLIRSQLTNAVNPAELIAQQLGIRNAAEHSVQQKLKGLWLKKLFFGIVLKYARETIKNRENMRIRRTRAYGLAKELFHYLAVKMVEQGALEHPDDIYYLTVNDLQGYCLHGLLNNMVEQTRETYKAYELLTPPDRMVFNGDHIPFQSIRHTYKNTDRILYGTGISTGVIEAECIVLSKPDFDQPVQGKILVTRMTDPAWVFLMTRSVGLISEKGSSLSHTAIVGRELGLPVIIGATDATKILKTGMRIRMDCNSGRIEILDR